MPEHWGVCPVCEKRFRLTWNSKYYAHGPRHNRCPGSNKYVAGSFARDQVGALQASLERAVSPREQPDQ